MLFELLFVSIYPFIMASFMNSHVIDLLTNTDNLTPFTIYVFSFFLIGYLFNNYEGYRIKKWIDMFMIYSITSFIHFLSLSLVLSFDKEVSPIDLGVFSILLLLILISLRTFIEWGVLRWIKSEKLSMKVAIINYGIHGKEYIETISANSRFNQTLILSFSFDESDDIEYMSQKINEYDVDLIVISDENKSHAWTKAVLMMADYHGIASVHLPYSQSFLNINAPQHVIGNLIVREIRKVPLDNFINRIIKRITDITISGIAIILLSPIFILISLLIKITSVGPIFFIQERVGFKNKTFKMLKFRTMKVSDEASWVGAHDPRITPLGRFLRWTSLDEIPQLFNILVGSMSVVGPRPERADYVTEFSKYIDKYRVKHAVKPGLTGLAQINGLRGNTSIEKRIEFDIYYIENWSIFLDLYIILRTFMFGFLNKEEL
jgi:exopolysaccharide biosynthesis polyprenyl glycosylphosphotransferase